MARRMKQSEMNQPESERPQAERPPSELPETRFKRYRVSLVWNPETEVLAANPEDAVAEYDRVNGIISTPHRHEVTEVADAQ
jgi:hypothetical protein